MRALKAHVRGGRLVMDEPTDLPEGTEVELALIDDGELDAGERARLIESIAASEQEIASGDWIDGSDLIAQLRQRREAPGR